MSDPTPPAAPAAEPTAAPVNEPASGLPANDPNGEGATQEEIDAALKSSGIKVPATPPAATDEEEGDDPDPVDPDAPAVDDDDEPADDEEDPAPKPPKVVTPPVADDATDDEYSFQVEDANGVTYKIDATADIEDVLKEFEPKNNGQIIAILDQLRTVKEQKATDDAKVAEDIATEERRTRASELLTGWQEEAKVLQGSKRIAEGKDGETRINEVYKFMADENDARMKAGKPTLNSFEDALDKLENKETRAKQVADDKADKDKARENGSKVGGASAPASSSAPVYRAGSAKNSNQALRAMGLLE